VGDRVRHQKQQFPPAGFPRSRARKKTAQHYARRIDILRITALKIGFDKQNSFIFALLRRKAETGARKPAVA
jgi:hypothetical protein